MLRFSSAVAVFDFGLPQLDQQSIYSFRWFSGLVQTASEVIHPHNRQSVLRAVHVDIAFYSSYIKLASFSLIVAEEGELVEYSVFIWLVFFMFYSWNIISDSIRSVNRFFDSFFVANVAYFYYNMLIKRKEARACCWF